MRLSRTVEIGDALMPLIIPLLLEVQKGVCSVCREPMEDAQVHHKRYGLDITLYDLELIHGACHGKEHGKKDATGKKRKLG